MNTKKMDLSAWNQPDNWISFHIFYHTGDRSELAVRLIYPTIKELLYSESIEAFFFVRYSLGGPHIRLRLLPRPDQRNSVHHLVKQRSEQLLSAYPSPLALTREEIRKQNTFLLAQDPNEQDNATYPDNCCCEVPFRPEVERYGGPDLLVHSLLFFTLSSSRALELLTHRFKSASSEWLATALGLLRRFTLGFASDVDELQALAVTPPLANAQSTARIVARADQIFERSQESFLRLFRQDVERLSLIRFCSDDFGLATSLSRELNGSAAPIRRRVLTSHLHMTANRLGLRNSDEIYLMHMLGRSLAAIKESEPWCWVQLERALARRKVAYDTATTRLCNLLHPALESILTRSENQEIR